MFKELKYFCIFVLLFACQLRAEAIDDIIIEETPPEIPATIPVEEIAPAAFALNAPLEEQSEAMQVFEPVPFSNTSLLMSRSLYLDATQFPGEACQRICVPGDRRVCYFKFMLEHYQAMGVACGRCARGVLADCEHPQCVLGDGIEKGIMSINRQVPGPAIQVCKDDQVVVDVVNQAHGTAAAIHWHGMHMRETPHMDGVPFVTQCPIPYATTFRYDFRAAEPGTQFYHSHAGHHKINGQYGALIVREPTATVSNGRHYDFDLPEHHILLSDWMHSYGEKLFPGLPGSGGIYPDSLLINGRGSYIEPKTLKLISVPPTRYYVKPGKRYRFRLINAVSHACPIQLQFELHSLAIIATDSFNVEPSSYDTLVSNSGERYDFVLYTNHTQGDFWIRARGLGICSIHPTDVVALLRYSSNDAVTKTDAQRTLPMMPDYQNIFPEGSIINHPNATCFGRDKLHCMTELQAEDEDNLLRYAVPDHRFHLAFHNYPVPNEELFEPGTYNHFANLEKNLTIVGAINNLSMILPSSPPLTQPRDIVESDFCNELNWPQKCRGKRLCPCVHRLETRLNSIVELVLVDETNIAGRMHHPFHLHGYRLMVTNLGQHPSGRPMTVALMKIMERQRSVPRNPFNPRPPFKDTVSIPSHGFAIVRFRANNPGFWIMHCHYEWHLAIGMGLVLQVGRPRNMVSAPKDFPRCGNYLPRVRRPR